MAQLSLRTRRDRARGISARAQSALGARKRAGLGNRATLTTAMAGTNNDITLIAKSVAAPGNLASLTIAVAGNNTPLSVSVSGNDITVNARTDGTGAVLSTAKEVVDKLLATPAASALVWAQTAPGNDGTGVVAALAKTNLAGATATPAV